MLHYSQYEWLVSWPFMVGAVGIYLISIWALRQVMEFRDKLTLTTFMQVYNSVQILCCAYMLQGFLRSCFSLTNPFGLNSQYSPEAEWFIFIHYLTKYLDFFDTWIMILKKNDRQLSFLHVYHHSSIGVIWGFLLQSGHGNGTAYFGAAINSLIHLMMYSHYLYTSFGFQNPFKIVVTRSQIVQFYMCIIHAVLGVTMETVFPSRLAWLQFAYHISMIILFNDFFTQTYSSSSKKIGKDGKSSLKEAKAGNGTTNGTNGHHKST